MYQLQDAERMMVEVVRDWVNKKVRPEARDLEREDEYPSELINEMRSLGIFGLVIPSEYGGTGVSAACFARITEELSRGWMSLAGAMGSHSVIANLIVRFGRPDQRDRYLPLMATGELRAAMALTEPSGGSDLQAMTTVAVRDQGDYLVNGSKMWITNAEHAGLLAVLLKTDPESEPPHRGMSILLMEKVPGLTVSSSLPKLGYRGIETCEISFDGCRVQEGALLGEHEGQGFIQMMQGLELARIQVAARALGVARAAFEDALEYSQQRVAFGKPIWQHQSIGNYLADMATKLHAARTLILAATAKFDRGERCDLEAGVAKLYASEMCMEVTFDAMRIHGAYGYSTEYDIERYYRDAPLMVIGEGTNEIQRNLIAKELVARGVLKLAGD